MKMHLIAVLGIIVGVATAHARLDNIDADGVTETGGAGRARMLTRTTADGKLDASLLPTLPGWAAKPVPNLYFAAAGAASGGNGSVQYPFATLTEALTKIPGGAAVVLTPGSYSGSGVVTAGSVKSICGLGAGVTVTSLSVSTTGASPATEIRLCGLSVGTLTLTGGKINVRLTDATVTTLTGTATDVTVTRMDLGAKIGAHTLPASTVFTDSYVGHPTAPEARKVVGDAGGPYLSVAGDRATVGTETVAYLSDVSASAAAINVSIDALRTEDTRLAELLTAEAKARTNDVTSVLGALESATNSLKAQIAKIGSGWQVQIADINSSIGNLGTAISDLGRKESNDVVNVIGQVNLVRAEFAAADVALEGRVKGYAEDKARAVSEAVPGIADARALFQIENKRDSIVEDATNEAAKYTDAVKETLSATDTAIEGRLDTAEGDISAIQINYRAKINQIIQCLSAIKSGSSFSVPDPL